MFAEPQSILGNLKKKKKREKMIYFDFSPTLLVGRTVVHTTGFVDGCCFPRGKSRFHLKL